MTHSPTLPARVSRSGPSAMDMTDTTAWFCPDLQWTPGRPAMLVGAPSSGKTLAAQAAALAVLRGAPIWGRFPIDGPRRVLHVDFEQGKRSTWARYKWLRDGALVGEGHAWADTMALHPGAAEHDVLAVETFPADLQYTGAAIDVGRLSDLEELWVAAVGGAGFVIVDSLRNLVPAADENDSRIGFVVQMLHRVSERTGAVVLLMHHTGRSAKTPRGSNAIEAMGGSIFHVERPKGKPARMTHVRTSEHAQDGCREHAIDLMLHTYAALPGDTHRPQRILAVDVEPGERTARPAPTGAASANPDGRALALIREATARGEKVHGKGALATMLGISRSAVIGIVDRMLADGSIRNTGTENRPIYEPFP